MRTIKIGFCIKGNHFWPQSKYPELAKRHIHNFYISATIQIDDNNNREIEFLNLRDKLRSKFYSEQIDIFDNSYDFKDKSCGDIGELVVEKIKQLDGEFNLKDKKIMVEVYEEKNNSGEVGEIIYRII